MGYHRFTERSLMKCEFFAKPSRMRGKNANLLKIENICIFRLVECFDKTILWVKLRTIMLKNKQNRITPGLDIFHSSEEAVVINLFAGKALDRNHPQEFASSLHGYNKESASAPA